MTSPKISLVSYGNNLRRLPILNGLDRAFKKLEVNSQDSPDYCITLDLPTYSEKSPTLIYYDTEGLYENLSEGSPDIIFTVEENAIKSLEQFYNCPVFHLPLGVDLEVYKAIEVYQDIDIIFCGTLFDPRPEVLSWLKPLSEEFKVQVITPASWASRLKSFGNIEIISNNEWVSVKEVVNLYLRSKIILCINRSKINRDGTENKTIGRGFNETALRRCTFIDNTRNITPYFVPGEEIVLYPVNDEGETLRSLLRYYLLNPSQRKSVAEKGFEHTYRNHTWEERAKQILEVIN